MYKPLISVIITVLNGEETIRQCLKSISDQTFPNYELVIVDGGSTDRTLQIINESNILNKIVKVVPGIGLYAGLNAGIKLSSGKWLYFIGADDEFYSINTLQKVADIIHSVNSEVKVLVGSVECIKQEMLLKPMFGSPYFMRHQVHHQGMFYERSIFDKMLYDETMRIASDYMFNLELALSGIPHRSMDIIVCNFGGDGISENQMNRGFAEMQVVHKRLFSGVGKYWAVGYFWVRRKTGKILRQYKLSIISKSLKKTFG